MVRKKTLILLCAVILIFAAILAVSCGNRRSGGNGGGNSIAVPELAKVTAAREAAAARGSKYIDTENTLCLRLDNEVCEPVRIILEFNNDSNFDIYSVKINSVEYDKSKFLRGYSPKKVEIKIEPLFDKAGSYSFELTDIYYSTGTKVNPIKKFDKIVIPVRVAPTFNVTLDLSQTALPEGQQARAIEGFRFGNYMDFLSSESEMNDVAVPGYGFVGWYTKPDPDISKESPIYSYTERYEFFTDVTFYAIYDCLYTFNANESEGATTITGLTNTGRKNNYFTLPDTLGGYPVKYIAREAFRNTNNIYYIECNESLIAIKQRAFQDCTSLRGIIFNEGLTEIEAYAFSGCTKLDNMDKFPSTLTTLGNGVFEYCGWQTKIGSLTVEGDKTLIIPATLTSIGDNCFRYSKFNAVYFEDYGEYVPTVNYGKQLFYSSESLETIRTAADISKPRDITNGSNGLRRIPEEAFAYCKNLKNVYLSEGLTEIGPKAFMCVAGTMQNFTALNIPDTLEVIGLQAFANVPVSAINFKADTSSRLRRLGDYCFQESNLSGRLLLKTPMLDSWGASPFWGSTKLTSIFLYTNQVPDDFAVNNKNLLTGQGLSNRIKYYVPEDLLDRYRTKWKVEYSVGGVGRTEELNIYAIEDVHPSGAYSYELKFNNAAPYYGSYIELTNIFDHAGTAIEIPDTITIGETPYPIKEIGAYVAGASITSVKFAKPEFIININDYAFRYSENLVNFCKTTNSGSRFEDFVNLERIGVSAFEGSGISRFIAPLSLKYIGDDAFFGCKSLNKVIISDKSFGETAVGNDVTIKLSAFNSCSSLDTVVVGKRVNVISSNAFGNCAVLTVFVMEHESLPLFPDGTGSGIIGILGNNNSTVTIYAKEVSLRSQVDSLPSSSIYFSYKQYRYGSGYWDYAANSGNGKLITT